MRRFQFRLERLLKIRQYREREWELKLADITGKCIVLEKKILKSRDNISHTLDKRSGLGGTIDIYDLIANEMYIARMKQDIVNAGIELEQRKREREKVKQKYLEPKAQLDLALKTAPYANSMIDVSDGLAPEIKHICDESNCGAIIYKNKIIWLCSRS